MEQLGGFAAGRMERVAQMLAANAAGLVQPTIGARYPLERAADAHLAIANRTTVGKGLLVIRGG
jgi:NADPH2:quinone reductase